MATNSVPAVVEKYLRELEVSIKRQSGVVPEEALRDAREDLCRRVEGWEPHAQLDWEAAYARILSEFGTPETLAQQYSHAADSPLVNLPEVAMLDRVSCWRIHCAKCGRSQPAIRAGIIRLGTPPGSADKWTLGWCGGCHRPRFLTLSQDLKKSNLTDHLLGNQRTKRSWGLGAIVCGAVALLITFAWTSYSSALDSPPSVFQSLPSGWSIKQSRQLSQRQTEKICERWRDETQPSIQVQSIHNTLLLISDQKLQINTIICDHPESAKQIAKKLRLGKSNPRSVCQNKNYVFELVVRTTDDMDLALKVRDKLELTPANQTYSVRFKAIPIRDGNWMKLNELFNLLAQSDRSHQPALGRFQALSSEFQFVKELTLRKHGQGPTESDWEISPVAGKPGMPMFSVSGKVTSTRYGAAPADAVSTGDFLRPTEAWPVDDPLIAQLASQITKGQSSLMDQVTAIGDWIHSPQGIRFGGDITGSRYGVAKVLRQRFGHCWDYSDLFITLCRNREIPCRQVYGWLAGSEGHVWAEVLINGSWHPIDPTTNGSCGSDYIPIADSVDGRMPLVYASLVEVSAR